MTPNLLSQMRNVKGREEKENINLQSTTFQGMQSDENKEAAGVMSPQGLGLGWGAGACFTEMWGLRWVPSAAAI